MGMNDEDESLHIRLRECFKVLDYQSTSRKMIKKVIQDSPGVNMKGSQRFPGEVTPKSCCIIGLEILQSQTIKKIKGNC